MPAPKLIIHGGAGAITRENLSPKAWAEYSSNLLRIYRSTAALLDNGVSALDAATHAVRLFEDCELFNCGKGAVFTRDGTIELEASVMVTHPYRKRYCAATLLSHVKHPIEFVREMLLRGEHDGAGDGNSGGDGDPAGGSGGAQGHCCLSGDGAEKLAREWGLEMVKPKYFWTRKRWEQHRRGLGKPTGKAVDDHKAQTSNTMCDPRECPKFEGESMLHTRSQKSRCSKCAHPSDRTPAEEGNDSNTDNDDGEGWDGIEYLPQGTVGCVALDRDGTICVATSTGGLTNKLAGRIGDTPTVGAGFWAEEWESTSSRPPVPVSAQPTEYLLPPVINDALSTIQRSFLGECLPLPLDPPQSTRYHPIISNEKPHNPPTQSKRAVALSGTGNGDSFLRLSACRTAAAIVRFSPPPPDGLMPIRTLASAVNQISGPGGELQRSAGGRWGVTGEGEGGMIGIEYLDVDDDDDDDDDDGRVGKRGEQKGKGRVVFDFNCGGMMRSWVDAGGRERVMVFRQEY